MNPSKWNLVSMVMLSLISTGIQESSTNYERQQRKRHTDAPAQQSTNVPPYWEYILREFVFKTISSSPLANHDLYKRLLNARFYGGPFPSVPSDASSVVLSRGDVYYLPNDHWLLCQEGCNDCEPCNEHTHPTVKWLLRRIKRLPFHGPTRHDLQLTIIPQIDGSYRMTNLWPRSYVYVTTPYEEAAYSNDKLDYRHLGNATGVLEDSVPFIVERSSQSAERRVPGEQSNSTIHRHPFENDYERNVGTTVTSTKPITTETTTSEHTTRQRYSDVPIANVTATSPVVSTDYAKTRSKQSLPKLILGTDQLGQKHLVHLVPADGSPNSTDFVASNLSNATGSGQHRNRTAYQRMLRKIFDSLSSNKRSIEGFLDPRIGKRDQQVEEHQQQETRNGLTRLGQLDRFHRVYNEGIRNGTLVPKRWPLVLNWHRQRRKSNDDASNDESTIGVNRTSKNSNDINFWAQNDFIDRTFDRGADRNRNISDSFDPKSTERNYYNGNASNSGAKFGDGLHGTRQNKILPRKFKIVVTTESTTKSMNRSNEITNHGERVPEKSKQIDRDPVLERFSSKVEQDRSTVNSNLIFSLSKVGNCNLER
ncbi:uncharacterized protein LOC143153659 [Ptiloglossa arizonensis]|uniref:uncharacterized protein LOC143153659 n=1 Tax=Ptiloglossa arizonensis TaxID=3350558 RepID=UPI003F9FC719